MNQSLRDIGAVIVTVFIVTAGVIVFVQPAALQPGQSENATRTITPVNPPTTTAEEQRPTSQVQLVEQCQYAQYSGSGTTRDPYKIRNVSSLQCIGSNKTKPGMDDVFVLTDDINAGRAIGNTTFHPIYNWSRNASNINGFNGTFNGNGHTIYGLNIRGQDNVGLFARIANGGVVRNIAVGGASVTGKYNVGVIAGHNEGVIKQISVTGVVIGSQNVGGVAGVNSHVIRTAYVNASVGGQSSFAVGGVTGSNTGNITYTRTVGVVRGSSFVGGIAGRDTGGRFSFVEAESRVIGHRERYATTNLGGIIGKGFRTTITNSTVNAVIGHDRDEWSEVKRAGGIIGSATLTNINNVDANVTVFGQRNIGGAIGVSMRTRMRSIHVSGNVSGTRQIGGVVGHVVSSSRLADSTVSVRLQPNAIMANATQKKRYPPGIEIHAESVGVVAGRAGYAFRTENVTIHEPDIRFPRIGDDEGRSFHTE